MKIILEMLIKKKIAPSKNKEKNLIIFSFFKLINLFCKSFFIIKFILKNKIMAIISANTFITRYDFIDYKFADILCQILEMKLQCLIKFKQI